VNFEARKWFWATFKILSYYGGEEIKLHAFLISVIGVTMNFSLWPGKGPAISWIGGWMGPQPFWTQSRRREKYQLLYREPIPFY
jgi:hypothetical protein